jgi:CDGSH-type Zn-finger protein
VFYDRGRCRHYAECVRGLPQVFDPTRRPWIRGDLVLDTPEGPLAETRAALCACGRTQNQPFCDGACGVNAGASGGTRTRRRHPPVALNQRSAPVARADRCDEVAVRTPNLPLQLSLPGQIASPCGPCGVGVKVTRAPGFVGEGEADRGDDAAEDLEADGIVIDAQLFIRAHGRMASAKGVHQARRHSRRQLRAALSDAAGSSPAASADLAPIREFLGRWTMPSWPAWPSRRPRRRAISARNTGAAHLGGRPSGGRMGAMAGPPWGRGPDHSAGTASTAAATV